jgi:hypothetical protein
VKVLFISDGPRDVAALPAIVCGVLRAPAAAIEPSDHSRPWSKVKGHGKGYCRRMQAMIALARANRIPARVCTVDCDNAARRKRLGDLHLARDNDRNRNSPLPAALGEARPHLEAWLIDDPDALRQALPSCRGTDMPSFSKIPKPKEWLNTLLDEDGCEDGPSRTAKIVEIANRLDHSRC